MTFSRTMMLAFGGLLMAAGQAVSAQDIAPTPKRSPRTPVSQQALAGNKTSSLPPSRNVEGAARIIDTEKLRIGDVEMRLFGVVPPQLSASYGPQARALLDNLTMGVAVRCTIRDRDRSGWFLATCRGANDADFALELLRRGLAVTARGSLRPTELAGPYEAAEQAAQAQKLGLWSVTLPPAVSEAKIREARARSEVASATADTTAKDPAAKSGEKPEARDGANPAASAETAAMDEKAGITLSATPLETAKASEPLPVTLQYFPTEEDRQKAETAPALERYQLLVTGLLMLVTALGVLAAWCVQKWIDRREELRSIAAALRGELMAARAVCQARLATMASDADEKSATWPRIRAMVFQAYVGRLGLLGAELSRQIASIYGQASDYAAYYNAMTSLPEGKAEPASKKQALQTLVRYIEEVLPRLAHIERQTLPFHTPKAAKSAPQKAAAPSTTAPAAALSSAAIETGKPASAEPVTEKENKNAPAANESAPAPAAESVVGDPGAASVSAATGTHVPALKSTPLWGVIRRFATQRLERARKPPVEDQIPDYTSMTDEEIEALAYGNLTEEEDRQPPAGKVSNAG